MISVTQDTEEHGIRLQLKGATIVAAVEHWLDKQVLKEDFEILDIRREKVAGSLTFHVYLSRGLVTRLSLSITDMCAAVACWANDVLFHEPQQVVHMMDSNPLTFVLELPKFLLLESEVDDASDSG